MPSGAAVPILEFKQPLDFVIAVEALITTNARAGNELTAGQIMAAAENLLTKAVLAVAGGLKRRTEALEFGKSRMEEAIGILSSLERLQTLQHLTTQLAELVYPAVKAIVIEQREMSGDSSDHPPTRAELISTAVLEGLGVDLEAYNEHFERGVAQAMSASNLS